MRVAARIDEFETRVNEVEPGQVREQFIAWLTRERGDS